MQYVYYYPTTSGYNIHIKYSITTLKNILVYSNLLFDTVSRGKIISVS